MSGGAVLQHSTCPAINVLKADFDGKCYTNERLQDVELPRSFMASGWHHPLLTFTQAPSVDEKGMCCTAGSFVLPCCLPVKATLMMREHKRDQGANILVVASSSLPQTHLSGHRALFVAVDAKII